METVVGESLAQSRANTDASLDAERATTDAAIERAAATAQRVLDDLIERDRILADERLLEFREGADRALARDRSTSPAPDRSAVLERRAADKDRAAERQATDALVEGERDRADAVAAGRRRACEADRARLEVRRLDMNGNLLTERNAADVGVSTPGGAKEALAHGEDTPWSNVLGMVTHELRNPLAVITSNAQFIVEASNEASIREGAHEVSLSAARMARILTDLLDVTRIQSGAFRITRRPHDVGMLLHEVLRSYRSLFADRGLAFTVDIPAALVVAVFDYDRIVQVLSNLLGNAMKFVAANGTIRLQVERRASEMEFALIDTGPGIHPSALPHVFKRFWQIDGCARRGLGLGLYICERIVEAHGGRIWVESDLGKGTTFRFTVPAPPDPT
jgi:signal transduction histidine kinase